MRFDDNFKRSLKGFIARELKSSKSMFIIISAILFAIPVFYYATMIILYLCKVDGSGSGSSGVLYSGFGTTAIVLGIIAILVTGKKKMNLTFFFPTNRKVYGLGVFIVSVISANILLIISSVAAMFELVLGKIVASIFSNVIIINNITIENFLLGYWISMLYVIFGASLVYFAFMYIRHRFPIAIGTALIIGGLFIVGFGRSFLYEILSFVVLEQSPLILSIKLIGLTAIMNLLGFIPLRNLEVKA